jgi:hypothetical protein
MLYTEISITMSQNPCLNPLRHQFIIHVQPTEYCDVTMYNILMLQCLTYEFPLRILNQIEVFLQLTYCTY